MKCARHGCWMPTMQKDCENKKMSEYSYCIDHKCLFPDCDSLVICTDIFLDGYFKKLSDYCVSHNDASHR